MKKNPLRHIAEIYSITNTTNGHQYVGSAVSIATRWSRHQHDMRRGVHHSIYLQRAVKKYGIERFKFDVLEITPPDEHILITREQYYLEKLKPAYNMSKESHRNVLSEETRRKNAERRAKEYIVTFPNGEQREIRNLKRFSLEHGLDDRYMLAVSRGRQYSHRGFRVRRKHDPFPEYELRPKPRLKYVEKDGVVYEIHNVRQFEREHGMSMGYLQRMLSGEFNSAKGFRRYDA